VAEQDTTGKEQLRRQLSFPYDGMTRSGLKGISQPTK
jgi:hypothetical protein